VGKERKTVQGGTHGKPVSQDSREAVKGVPSQKKRKKEREKKKVARRG